MVPDEVTLPQVPYPLHSSSESLAHLHLVSVEETEEEDSAGMHQVPWCGWGAVGRSEQGRSEQGSKGVKHSLGRTALGVGSGGSCHPLEP